MPDDEGACDNGFFFLFLLLLGAEVVTLRRSCRFRRPAAASRPVPIPTLIPARLAPNPTALPSSRHPRRQIRHFFAARARPVAPIAIFDNALVYCGTVMGKSLGAQGHANAPTCTDHESVQPDQSSSLVHSAWFLVFLILPT